MDEIKVQRRILTTEEVFARLRGIYTKLGDFDAATAEGYITALEAQLATAQRERDEARRKLETYEYGENYIKQFLDAKEKCSAMYPPEEVYAPGQLECWAEEHGYKLTIASPEVKP